MLMLHPVEIKKTANPGKEHIENFSALNKLSGINLGTGCVVCMYDKCVHIDGNNVTIPVTWI